ncbi:MAG TPA: MFS transporter [Mycobacteriales bacterium]|nr:MFS transporter [Mycobacteriales bacterium]
MSIRSVPATSVAPGRISGEAAAGRWVVFAIVSVSLFMASVDQTIVATALPTLQRDLHAQVNWSSWTITIYALGQILIMPLAGRLSEQWGRRRVFIAATVLFTATSLCCGFANNIYLLVSLRALQAFGGGAFMPSATGIVAELFGPDRDRALGLFSSIFPIGGIVGPILGGVFVTYLSWRWIFFVNLPLGMLVVALSLALIPRSRRSANSRLDIHGVVLLGMTLLPAMFGIAYLGNGSSSPASPEFLLPELVAIISAVLFVRHSSRHSHPFIPADLLYGHGFGVMNLLNFLYGSAALGFAALVPLYAEDRYDIHSLASGTLLIARAVGMIAVAGMAAMLLRRTGYRRPMVVGFLITASGLFLMARAPWVGSAYTWLAVSAALCGIGMGMSNPAASNAALQLRPEEAASIAGLRGMFRQSGSIVAVSITTSILASNAHPGLAQAHIFLVFAAIIVCILPLVFMVPEHRGTW